MSGVGDARAHARRAVLLGLLALVPQQAALAWDISQPKPSSESYGIEIGPMIALPLPSASVHQDVIGFDAGLTFTAKSTPTFGVGADFSYHYWPVSDEFKQQFNEDQLFNILKLGGDAWGLQVFQLGAHFRFATPVHQGVRPWIQVGAGVYRVDPYTTGYRGDAGFFTIMAQPLKHTNHFGSWAVAGVDLVGGPHARMGVDASYHFVECSEDYGKDLQVFTMGVHALFSP